MTPITNDDSAPQLTDALITSNRPVRQVVDAFFREVNGAIENRQSSSVPIPSTDRDQVATLYA